MNLVLGVVLGSLIGWGAFALLRLNAKQGLQASLALGFVGGGIGMQLGAMMSPALRPDGPLNVFALVLAAAIASTCLIVASVIGRR